MRYLNFMRRRAALVAAAALLLAGGLLIDNERGAQAQAGPSGSFLVVHNVSELGALITNTARTAGTVNSADQTGSFISVSCTFNQSAHTNSPSTTFKIQGKDAASGTYWDMITSAAITADATPTSIAAGMGNGTVANVSTFFPVPKTWRVVQIIAGTTPIVTGTVDCRLHT